MSAGPPRVAVVHNEPALPRDHPDAVSEADVLVVAGAVDAALRATGFDTVIVPAGPPLAGFVARLTDVAPDAVFSLIEGFGRVRQGSTYLTGVLELLGLSYTGAPVEALALCQSKAQTKAVLRGHGLPTASALVIGPGDPIPGVPGSEPVVVKPDAEDGSLGVDQGSVVTEPAALAAKVARLRRVYGGSVVVEPYLPGPEFDVSVVALTEPRALAVRQVIFSAPSGHWPILSYTSKWSEAPVPDTAYTIACPAPVEPELSARLSELAVAAFRATGCRDYARVDLRVDARGEPMILEVNPNPDLGPNAGFAKAVRVSGLDYAEVVAGIARQALGRR